jgi:ABC-type multidrug transport system fused ATPase/permease subunit
MFEVKHLSYSYPKSKIQTIKDVSFSIKKGEIFGFLGPSGAGKSTLIEALYIFLKEKNHSVVLLRQSPSVIADNIVENITFGITDRKKLLSCMNIAGLNFSIGDCESEKITSRMLSGGQVQRMNIARALYFDADIILLDEFTSALDQETELDILKSIKRLCENGKIIICISHRPAAEKLSSRIYSINHNLIKSI